MCYRVHGLIGAIDEEAGRSVADEFRQGAEQGRDDRRPGRGRLDDRQGIEVDYCPECRGIWLDRGELDKLIEKSMVAAPSHEQSRPSYSKEGNDARRGDQGYTKKSKKESFLSNMFDF